MRNENPRIPQLAWTYFLIESFLSKPNLSRPTRRQLEVLLRDIEDELDRALAAEDDRDSENELRAA